MTCVTCCTRINVSDKGKKKFYSTEERILMSSILHLEFPLLIKKLDYCLQDPVPDKKRKNLSCTCRNAIFTMFQLSRHLLLTHLSVENCLFENPYILDFFKL